MSREARSGGRRRRNAFAGIPGRRAAHHGRAESAPRTAVLGRPAAPLVKSLASYAGTRGWRRARACSAVLPLHPAPLQGRPTPATFSPVGYGAGALSIFDRSGNVEEQSHIAGRSKSYDPRLRLSGRFQTIVGGLTPLTCVTNIQDCEVFGEGHNQEPTLRPLWGGRRSEGNAECESGKEVTGAETAADAKAYHAAGIGPRNPD